jgi:hypothetical protein
MQRELLGIVSVGFDVTGQQLTIYVIYVRQILEKKWEYNEAVHQLFVDFSYEGGFV